MIIVTLEPEKPFTNAEIKKLSKEVKGCKKITTEIKKGKQYILLYLEENEEK